MTDDTHVLDLLPAFVLGSLDTDEIDRVQQHLLTCSICRAEADSLQAVTEQIALVAPAAVPSPNLKARLMEGVRSVERPFPVHEQAPQRSWLDRILPVWGIISLILIIGLVGFNVLLWQRLDRLEVATSPGGMHAIPLSASQPGSRATGFVIIGADGMNGALVVDGLPPLAESQQYQLWLVRDGERTSGAIFSTDDEHYGGTRIKVDGSLFEYSSAGVTIEPAGGSSDPTGPQVLSGSLLAP